MYTSAWQFVDGKRPVICAKYGRKLAAVYRSSLTYNRVLTKLT